MTTLAKTAANRSFAFLGTFFSAMEAAIAMSRAVHYDSAHVNDLNKVRAIAEAI